MGIASIVIGIMGLILGFIPIASIFGVGAAIIGIILGVVGRKDEAKKGVATVGLTISVIALIIAVIFTLVCGACLALGDVTVIN